MRPNPRASELEVRETLRIGILWRLGKGVGVPIKEEPEDIQRALSDDIMPGFLERLEISG